LINTIIFGILLLIVRTRHFPLSYKGGNELEIGVNEWIKERINEIINVVSGKSDEIQMMLSSSA
jgi:hypothetical protein